MRRNYYSGKYSLDKHELLSAIHYALRYRKWRDEYDALSDSGKGISYDKDRVQSSGDYNPVEAAGIRRAELSTRINLIEQTAKETDPELYEWILQGVTDDFATFKSRSTFKGMPCGKDKYYYSRRKFFFLLSQKI